MKDSKTNILSKFAAAHQILSKKEKEFAAPSQDVELWVNCRADIQLLKGKSVIHVVCLEHYFF